MNRDIEKKKEHPARVITSTDRKVFAGAEKLMRTDRLFTDPTLNLASMSAMLGVNRETLSRAVNLLTGSNFTHYVNSFRVEEAKQLLKENLYHKNAIKISAGCGFMTPTTFYRAFKMITGTSPGEYLTHLKMNKHKK